MLLLCNKSSPRENSNVTVPHDLVCTLRCLRSLDMSHISIKELPDSVGNLMHMRYLDLSHTDIKELPESICSLCNLQTLILVNCSKLLILPKGTKDLMNLRHLDLTGCWHLRSMPPYFGRLTSLQRLHRFIAGNEVGSGISELKDMNELRATLCIDRVEDIINIEDAKEANLKRKPYIHKLVLRWSRSQRVRDAIDEELLECLEPHTSLRELTIDVYPGAKLPNWMGDSQSHLESIEFIHCSYCKTLPPLGQLPFLKYLTICMMLELESIGREFMGMLEVLNCPSITNLPKFPSLSDLLLDNCHERVLCSVHFLTSLSSLEILNFRRVDLLPDGLLQPLTALKKLKIKNLHRFKALQNELGVQDLQSLQRLEISCCPKLLSFAEKGLPSSLQHLSIDMCNTLKNLPSGLQNVFSLEELHISKCPKIVSFPEEKLGISLKNLRLLSCANLESLPVRLHELRNLESLSIQSCPKLACLPASGLPASLRSLSIMECALLKERCAEGGEDWPKIEHIPEKHIKSVLNE
ncbi:hypothetical protein GH714_017292 [Hevea brasiliensis]|uniref:R13L1/DRL21-like LRR repeat region domain-containing protein n=1 Tax=Hevea brasiliensis TaxID=3981 RepID=A0A6A6NAR1_HEVBR|nr:hypothetical protein GH714_017292 [Hevea brasiliensis]